MNSKLFEGDCLEILPQLDADSVDLVYLDPPFFTQKKHKLHARDRQREFSFDDLWVSHVEYAAFLFERLQAIKRVMSPTSSIFFHCDRNASHIVRLLLDQLFDAGNFHSEIIWRYRRWSNAKKGLLPAHQTIFYYTKSDNFTFNAMYQPYSEATNVDQLLQRRQRDKFGKAVYETDNKGNVIPSGGKKGVPLSDVWDIPYLNPKAKERTGYPTQKPILLLERIVRIASNEGDLVLDPFCGSGTTLVAANLLNRRAIGVDISDEALSLTRKRLENPIKTESRLLKNGRRSYKKANEKALAMLEGMDFAIVQRNSGIDAILKDDIDGSPIPVRVQRPNETIPEAANRLYQAAKTKNAAVMFLVAIKRGGYFVFGDEIPPLVQIVEAPALVIQEMISELKNSGISSIFAADAMSD